MTYAPRVNGSKGRHVGLGRMQPVPRVSLIIPAYNAEKYLGETIDSVVSQTMPDWELVLVDDGSTDATASIGQAYAESDGRVRVLRQPNGGVANARNNGFAACSSQSPYLLFLDGDDCLEPDMLAVMVNYLDSHTDVGMAHCEYMRMDGKGTRVKETAGVQPYGDRGFFYHVRYAPFRLGFRLLPPWHAETPFATLYSWPNVGPSLSVIRRLIYERTPGWDEAFGQPCEDTDLFLHIALWSKVHYVPRTLTRYRWHSGQSTNNAERNAQQREKLYQKWLRGSHLTPAQRKIVKEAWHFREGKLMPGLWFVWGYDHLRAGHVVEGIKCYLRVVRQLLSYGARILRPSPIGCVVPHRRRAPGQRRDNFEQGESRRG